MNSPTTNSDNICWALSFQVQSIVDFVHSYILTRDDTDSDNNLYIAISVPMLHQFPCQNLPFE